jgi:hypothetical protein
MESPIFWDVMLCNCTSKPILWKNMWPEPCTYMLHYSFLAWLTFNPGKKEICSSKTYSGLQQSTQTSMPEDILFFSIILQIHHYDQRTVHLISYLIPNVNESKCFHFQVVEMLWNIHATSYFWAFT